MANLWMRERTVSIKGEFLKCGLGLLAVVAVFGTANAQEEEQNTGQLEEVLVTATHRTENIQDIAVSVTAISGAELDKADIFDPATIALRVPNMTYGEFAPGQAIISLRGVNSADDGAGLDNSIALFLDGVYIGRSAAINFDMFDLERIEVLRGPQGTLFGRNAIGGAINVVTSKPSDEFVAKVGATVGNEGILRYRGLVSGAFSESLAGKLSFTHREHDGWVRNVLLNRDIADEDTSSIRGQLRFQSTNSDWLLSGDWMEDNRDDMGRTPMVNRAPLLQILAANGGGGDWETAISRNGFSDRNAWGVSLQGDIEFGRGVLTTITAYRHADTDWEMPSVGAPLGAIGQPFDEVIDDIVEDIDTFSQELRWTSLLEGNFQYTAGLYYMNEDTDRIEQFFITRAGTFDDPDNPFRQTAQGPQDNIGNEYAQTANETDSYAAYADVTWQPSDKWSFSLGARYTIDKKDYTAISVNCDLVRDNDPSIIGTQFENWPACNGMGGSLNIIAEAFEVNPSDDWNDFSPRLAAQYFAHDSLMFFGTVSKGFKSGGFAGSQGIESVASNPVDPETVWNYELGMKSDFFDRSLRLNVTAFYMDYQDLQIVRFGPVEGSAFGTFITTNIGSADIYGLEIESTWLVTENFQLSGHLALLDTEANDLIINGQDLSGTELRQAPEMSYNIMADYFLPSGIGAWNFHLEFSHVDEQLNDYLFTATVIDEQNLLDARIGWTSNSGQWEVGLWAKNLTDEAYFAHSYVIGPGAIGVWGPPRTYGVTATWYIR
jgi:iron complex outermembrane receptor protein